MTLTLDPGAQEKHSIPGLCMQQLTAPLDSKLWQLQYGTVVTGVYQSVLERQAITGSCSWWR